MVNENNLLKFKIMSDNGLLWKSIMDKIEKYLIPGVNIKEIDNIIGELLKESNAISAPINIYSFPGYSCISVNDCACHGCPEDYVLKFGDVVTVDLSFIREGYYIDGARNYVIIDDYSNCNKTIVENIIAAAFSQYLVEYAVKEANKVLNTGGKIYSNFFGKVMYALISKSQYNMCVNYCGHSIGSDLHMEPHIPNGNEQLNEKHIVELKEYDAFCIEPIISYKDSDSNHMKVKTDGWYVKNISKEVCFHYEKYIFYD